MLVEITQTFTLLKTASELIKGFNSIKEQVAIGDIKIELNNIILDLQANASSLNEKYNLLVSSKNDLEQKLTNLSDFKSQKEKYVLQNITRGIVAYTPKEKIKGINSQYWLCQNCLDNSQKFAVYQAKGHSSSYYYCPNCKNEICVPSYEEPQIPKTENWKTV